MSTANVAIQTLSYSGSNTVKLAAYKITDPTVEVASDFHAGPFTSAIFNFIGLQRIEHILRTFQVSNDTAHTILSTYPDEFFFIPAEGLLQKKDSVEWVAGVDTMPNGNLYPAGVSSFSNPDWIGWEVDIFTEFSDEYSKHTGYYSDITTGTLGKLQEGDIFEPGNVYAVHFALKINESSGTDTVGNDGINGKKYITANTTLLPADLGKKILVKGTASFITVTLPSLDDIPELKRMYIEMPPSDTARCVKFKTVSDEVIDFGNGNLTEIYLYPSESFEIYKESDNSVFPTPVLMWRIQNAQGNFLTAGEIVSDEASAANVINKTELNGDNLNADVFSRLYAYVLGLPTDQRVPYASWGSGDNRYKFSRKDNATNLFHVPDRRGMFERQSSASRLPGTFQANAMKDHQHEETVGTLPSTLFGHSSVPRIIGKYNGTGSGPADLTGKQLIFASPGAWVAQTSSDETVPDNVANKRYVRY